VIILRSFIAAGLLLLFVTPGFGASSATAVVWNGQSTGAGSIFDSLGTPRIGPGGGVVFSAFLSGSGINSSNDLTLWLSFDTLQLICQEGYPYPLAGTGVTALCPASGALNTGGRVFGSDFLSGPGVDSSNDTMRTMFVGAASSSVLVAREGDLAPETDAVFDQAFGDNRMGSADRVAFSSGLRGGTTNSGIWAGPATSMSLIVKEGDPAPGLGGDFQGFSSVVLSDSGALAFQGWTASGNSGLYTGSDGAGPSLVAGTGSLMPGGGTLLYPSSFAMNNGGEIALRGHLQSGSKGIWAASPGLRVVAIPGQPAPDFGSFSTCGPPSIGDSGDICFFAQTSVGADGLFCEIAGTLRVVAREDDSPSALAPGETVGDLLWQPVVNSSGQVLFLSQVDNGTGFDLTWWLRKTNGDLAIIARLGADLEVSPGVTKTVSNLNLLTGDYPPNIGGGDASALNDRGEVVFSAGFSDGSEGIFVGRPQPVLPDDIFRDGFEAGNLGAWSASTP
jgi:hypothetical protein